MELKFRLSEHAHEALQKREIEIEWIEQALQNPDTIESDKYDPELEHRLAAISKFGNRVLRVIVKRKTEPEFVVTVFFDRRIRRLRK